MSRSPFIDNAKGLLIAAVVWYHSLVVYFDSVLPPGVSGLQTFMLLFVMPGFAMLSGYTASPQLTEKRQDRLFVMLAAFIIFQMLNWIMGILNAEGYKILFSNSTSEAHKHVNYSHHSNETKQDQGAVPYPIPIFFPTVMGAVPDTKALPVTWFLLALLFWRTLTPIISRLRQPVLSCFAVGLLGLVVDLGFGSQQIVSFLPYYAIGVVERNLQKREYWWGVCMFPRGILETSVLDNETRSNERPTWFSAVKRIFFLVPLLSLILVSIFDPGWQRSSYGLLISDAFGCLYGLSRPSGFKCTSWAAWAMRVHFYLASLVAIYVVFRCVPKRSISILTKAGRNSFAIYLFHPLFLFNLVTLVIISRAVDILTHGGASVKGDGAPPFHGGIAFILITFFGFFTFLFLSLNCWRRCCFICLSPPVTSFMMRPPADRGYNNIQTALLQPGISTGVSSESRVI